MTPLRGGFLATAPTALGPILEPLELLRLAGVPEESGVRVLLALSGLFVGELCSEREDVGRADRPLPEVPVNGDDFGRNGTFFTVLVETALLRDEREDLSDVRELLRSTSNWCCNLAAAAAELVPLASGDSDFRIELVRRGNRFLLTREGGVPLRDLLRSNAVWVLVIRMLGRAEPPRTGSCLLGLLSAVDDLTTFLVLLFFESDP